jgi:hypothetical protein
MIRVFLYKLIVSYLAKIYPAFYGILKLITVCTKTHQIFTFWFSSRHPTPYYSTSLRSIFTLSQRLRLVLPSSLFPSEILHASLYSPRPTGLVHLILFHFITQEIYVFFCRAKTQNFHSDFSSISLLLSPLVHRCLPQLPVLETVQTVLFPCVREEIPFRRDKIFVFSIWTSIHLYNKGEDKRSGTRW